MIGSTRGPAGVILIARGSVGQRFSQSPQPMQMFFRTITLPVIAFIVIACSPASFATGQTSTHCVQFSPRSRKQ